MGVCLATNKNDQFQNEQLDIQKSHSKMIKTEMFAKEEKQTATQIHLNLSSQQEEKISLEDFDFLKVLGRGGYGKVMLVCYKPTQKLYAMKILRKDLVEKLNSRMYTQNERNIMVLIENPFIVKLHYAFQTRFKLYLIMDFMIGGELFFHLKRAYRFKEDKAKFYSAEIILALDYLHHKGIIYRDLKPENVLLGKDGHIKITDFGLSKSQMKEGEKATTICGTYEYMAPEIYQNLGHTQVADWYSLGALLYLMLAGVPPFYSGDKKLMLKNRLEKPIVMKEWFSDEAKDILKLLLCNDPQQRLGSKGANEVQSHPFFKDVNWDALYKKRIDPPFKPKVLNEKDLRHFDLMFTTEPVQDTPINEIGNKEDQYDRFTYIRPNDSPMNKEDKVSLYEQFVEENPNFNLKYKESQNE